MTVVEDAVNCRIEDVTRQTQGTSQVSDEPFFGALSGSTAMLELKRPAITEQPCTHGFKGVS